MRFERFNYYIIILQFRVVKISILILGLFSVSVCVHLFRKNAAAESLVQEPLGSVGDRSPLRMLNTVNSLPGKLSQPDDENLRKFGKIIRSLRQ